MYIENCKSTQLQVGLRDRADTAALHSKVCGTTDPAKQWIRIQNEEKLMFIGNTGYGGMYPPTNVDWWDGVGPILHSLPKLWQFLKEMP